MRPVAEAPGVELGIHLSPLISFSRATPPKPAKCDARTCPWWPYSNSKEFKTNSVMILTILFCALLSALAFNASIRYLLRRRRTVHHGPEEQGKERSKTQLMRPVAEAPGVELGIHLSPLISFSRATPPKPAKCDARTCPWWPYSNSKEFKTNTVMILTILFCALLSALAFNASICYLLRRRRTVHHGPEEQGVVDEQQFKPDLCSLATMVFSAGMNLVGAEAECSICLLSSSMARKFEC
ncbi:unnamed protein product [Ilex paraguariensis]|uniref:RING-type E3 ubiquitin transferase n=1 Tax=Ilex paraguariensis TaxID=185542 RepID=A0ABC8TKG4_9AQUA